MITEHHIILVTIVSHRRFPPPINVLKSVRDEFVPGELAIDENLWWSYTNAQSSLRGTLVQNTSGTDIKPLEHNCLEQVQK